MHTQRQPTTRSAPDASARGRAQGSALGRALAASLLLCAAFAFGAAAQEGVRPKEQTASVSGRVKVGERGAPGVAVALFPAEPGPDPRAVARAETDAEGFYRMAGLAPGRYSVVASAPGYVFGNRMRMGMGWPPGPSVMLAAGESVEDYDFTLTRGGVITGTVTDQDGRPVVGEMIQLSPAGEDQRGDALPYNIGTWQTDDRGVYRLYGLPAGKYRVAVGVDPSRGFGLVGGRREGGYYARVYHPEETDAARARIVEVTEGGEATGVDIKVGRLAKSFRARGRVVYAATGQPAPGVSYGYGGIGPQGRLMPTGPSAATNQRGEFEITGLLPGRYGVYASAEGRPEYSDVATFEITDGDASGLEVKLRPGGTITGAVVIENVSDRALHAQLVRSLSLHASSEPRQQGGPAPMRGNRVQVNPDGSFHVAGLPPGRTTLGAPRLRGLSHVRTEVNGAELRGGIEVDEGASITGVRVVFQYGTASVRGQVVAREGEQAVAVPAGTRVSARRPGGAFVGRPVEVDARGRFLLEGLPAGELEIRVNVFGPNVRATAQQLVHVSEGAESGVTLTLDLMRTPRPDAPPRPPEP